MWVQIQAGSELSRLLLNRASLLLVEEYLWNNFVASWNGRFFPWLIRRQKHPMYLLSLWSVCSLSWCLWDSCWWKGEEKTVKRRRDHGEGTVFSWRRERVCTEKGTCFHPTPCLPVTIATQPARSSALLNFPLVGSSASVLSPRNRVSRVWARALKNH